MTDKSAPSKGLDRLAEKAAAPPAAGRQPIDCGHFDIRIARDGTWFYRGSPLARLPLVPLFRTALRRDARVSYWLETPPAPRPVSLGVQPSVPLPVSLSAQQPQQHLIFLTRLAPPP